jgi:hypothetical protein
MKFSNTEVWGFRHAIRGARNPKNSWNRSDSFTCEKESCPLSFPELCPMKDSEYFCTVDEHFIIGEKDLALLQSLIRAGAEHRKFMRQIFVSVDITAPMYFFSEFDTYKVGTVANSTSKMHKLATTPITIDCFEMDDYSGENKEEILNIIHFCESLRQKYLETKDKKYWKELIRWLPESWLQTRTVTMNYENLLGMCSKGQRRFHKLNEWSGKDNPNVPNFISWARTLPYAQELIFLDELDEDKES